MQFSCCIIFAPKVPRSTQFFDVSVCFFHAFRLWHIVAACCVASSVFSFSFPFLFTLFPLFFVFGHFFKTCKFVCFGFFLVVSCWLVVWPACVWMWFACHTLCASKTSMFVFSTKLFSQLLFLIFLLWFGGWLNSRFGGYYVCGFSFFVLLHVYLPFCIRPHPHLPIPDHSCPLTPISIPCMTYREFSRSYTHKTYISAHTVTRKYPFWLLSHSYTPLSTLRTPLHPSPTIIAFIFITREICRNWWFLILNNSNKYWIFILCT